MLNCYKIIENRGGRFITGHNTRVFMGCGERNVSEMNWENEGKGGCPTVRSGGVSEFRTFWKGKGSVARHMSVSCLIQLETTNIYLVGQPHLRGNR